MNPSRRAMLSMTPMALCTVPCLGQENQKSTRVDRLADELYPTQDPQLVREIVGAAHSKLERVRELLHQHPALARAAWDWGFGDWETALGAASHTGQRDIAALLIEHGARPDIFTFAMLGHAGVVRAYVQAFPGIQRIHGPHGISLLKHAKAGGEKSSECADYLAQLGDADVGQVAKPIPDGWTDRYQGEYSCADHPSARMVVAIARNGILTIRRGADGSQRNLCYQGEHEFQPAGSQHVKIRFEVRENRVTGLAIVDGPASRSASRLA